MKSLTKKLFAATIALTLIVSVFLAGCAAVPTPVQSAPAGTPALATAYLGTAEPSPAVTAAIAQGKELSYVSVDINPSIELTLADGLVLEAKGYNDDGVAIILSTNVAGMTPQDAVSALVNSFASEGYIPAESTNTSIVITVAGGQDAGLADSLKQNAEQSLQTLGLNAQVLSTNVAEEIVQTANNCGLSIGRYLLLKQIALKEGISIEEAKDKYGAMKMGELLGMIENIDSFMGDVQQLSSILDSLTPEQLQMLEQARLTYDTTMKTAQQAFLKARDEAKNAFFTARDAAKDAFLATKDKDTLKTAKKQIKDAFALAKKTALDNLKQAKTQARTDFLAVIAGLGLDEATVDKLLDWGFDTNFDVNTDLGFGDENDVDADNQDKEVKDADEIAAPEKDQAEAVTTAQNHGSSAKDKDSKENEDQGKGKNGKGNSKQGD
jgi:molybdopterin converting factor small subunit